MLTITSHIRSVWTASRYLSTSGSSSNEAFDRNMKGLQRDGAARRHRLYNNNENDNSDAVDSDDDDVVDYDYFQREIALRLVDRLDDIKRDEGFPLALDVGSGPGHVYRAVCMDDAAYGEGGIGGIRKLVQLDSSEGMLHRDVDTDVAGEDRCGTYRLCVDYDGARLPFPDGTFDLVVSATALHRVNDLPQLFREVVRVLKPDGPFLFALVGGATLPELRSSLVLAELERDGGVSPHVGPFVDFTDVGTLLTEAGFALPTVDIDTLHLSYPDAMTLMEHLQRMGEGNACLNRRKDDNNMTVDTFVASAAIYQEMFGIAEDDDGNAVDGDSTSGAVEASVQIIYAIGWTPHESQPQPKARGSATQKVGDTSAPNTTILEKVQVVRTNNNTKDEKEKEN